MNNAKKLLEKASALLLRIEWAGSTENTGWDCCLFCGGEKKNPRPNAETASHRTGCTLAELLEEIHAESFE